jgi:hypothetical protein
MSLQNRVTPFGDVIADPGRGQFTGNRGCLCDEAGKLARRRWRLKAWITCQLNFKGWWRPVMQPGVWTELFFLDEATALAAGHRPCALCRRAEYNLYRQAWAKAQGLATPPKATEMDFHLHRERTRRDRSKLTFRARVTELPDGTMVRQPGPARKAMLIQKGRLMEWSPGGYVGTHSFTDNVFEVLTPKSSVLVLAAGYCPFLHASGHHLAAEN